MKNGSKKKNNKGREIGPLSVRPCDTNEGEHM